MRSRRPPCSPTRPHGGQLGQLESRQRSPLPHARERGYALGAMSETDANSESSDELMRRWHAATDPTDARADTRSASVPKSCVRSGNSATRDPRIPGSRVSSVASPKPDTPLEVAATSPRAPGRPRGGFAVIDWDRGREMYAQGASLAVVGAALGCTRQSVHAFSRRHSWERGARSAVREADAPDGRRPDVRVVPLLSLVEGGAPRVTRRSPEQILTDYLELFDKQLREGKVRADSAADLERCIRLLSHVRTEQAQSRAPTSEITLESMQRRHRELREHVRATVDDAICGVLGVGVPAAIDAECAGESDPAYERRDDADGDADPLSASEDGS